MKNNTYPRVANPIVEFNGASSSLGLKVGGNTTKAERRHIDRVSGAAMDCFIPIDRVFGSHDYQLFALTCVCIACSTLGPDITIILSSFRSNPKSSFVSSGSYFLLYMAFTAYSVVCYSMKDTMRMLLLLYLENLVNVLIQVVRCFDL